MYGVYTLVVLYQKSHSFAALTPSISDTPQLVCKHRTHALSMKYSMFISFYYNRSFPQNLSLWLLEKSEMINLQMLIQKNTFNVLSSSSPFEKTCSALSASVSLARTLFWNMRKPGFLVLWLSQAFHHPSICFNFLYFHRKVNMFKTPEMCLYFSRTLELDVLQLFLRDLFIILSRFLAGFCYVKISQAFQTSIACEKGNHV